MSIESNYKNVHNLSLCLLLILFFAPFLLCIEPEFCLGQFTDRYHIINCSKVVQYLNINMKEPCCKCSPRSFCKNKRCTCRNIRNDTCFSCACLDRCTNKSPGCKPRKPLSKEVQGAKRKPQTKLEKSRFPLQNRSWTPKVTSLVEGVNSKIQARAFEKNTQSLHNEQHASNPKDPSDHSTMKGKNIDLKVDSKQIENTYIKATDARNKLLHRDNETGNFSSKVCCICDRLIFHGKERFIPISYFEN